MKSMLFVAAASLSLAASTDVYADIGEGPVANTFFTQLPGLVAQADVPNAPTYAQNQELQTQAQNVQRVDAYAAQSSRGTWLFPPNDNQGANG